MDVSDEGWGARSRGRRVGVMTTTTYSFHNELNKISNGFWCFLGPQFDVDIAMRGFKQHLASRRRLCHVNVRHASEWSYLRCQSVSITAMWRTSHELSPARSRLLARGNHELWLLCGGPGCRGEKRTGATNNSTNETANRAANTGGCAAPAHRLCDVHRKQTGPMSHLKHAYPAAHHVRLTFLFCRQAAALATIMVQTSMAILI